MLDQSFFVNPAAAGSTDVIKHVIKRVCNIVRLHDGSLLSFRVM